MAKYCDVCKKKIGFGAKTKALDGDVCLECVRIANGSNLSRTINKKIEEIREFHKINDERKKMFNETKIIKKINSSVIHIDDNNKLFYIDSSIVYYSFEDVVSIIQETIVGPTITTTKSKGGISRAVIGGMVAGPAGAIVGANTASSKSISDTQIKTKTYIEINDYSGRRKVFVYNLPEEFKEILNYWINNNIEKNKSSDIDNIEEIKKYKKLLDENIITQEEFEKKKKELLKI